MENLIKQLNRAGKMLAAAIEQAAEKGEEKIITLISEEVYRRGYEESQIEEFFDLSRQSLETNPEEGILVNDVYIIGEKEVKKVIKAYRLEVSYRPEGFSNEQGLVMKVRGRVEEVTESFFYPEDDESIFH